MTASIALLSGIGPGIRRGLLAQSNVRRLGGRTRIVTEGTTSSHLHILLEGTVELRGTIGSREAVLTLLQPGEAFILAAVVKDAPALMSARTIEEAEILSIPAPLFRQAMRSDPVLAVKVAMELGSDFRSMVRHLRDHKLRTAKQRFATYLVRLSGPRSGAFTIELPVTKRLLASFLGIEPESLSRAVAELRDIGVEMEGRQVRVGNYAALATAAASDWITDDPNG